MGEAYVSFKGGAGSPTSSPKGVVKGHVRRGERVRKSLSKKGSYYYSVFGFNTLLISMRCLSSGLIAMSASQSLVYEARHVQG